LVVAIGERRDYDFWAKDIHLAEPGQLPMIRRGVERRLGPFLHCSPEATNTPLLPLHLLRFNLEANRCIQTCLGQKKFPLECVRGCVE